MFTNAASIVIGGPGAATPYPSPLSISGAGGPITDVDVTLHGLWLVLGATDVDVLLVSPGGVSVILMADVNGGSSFSPGIVLTFDDAAASSLPTSFVAGTYKPTNAGSFSDTTQPGQFATSLSVLNGGPRGGTWKLFVWDDASAGNFGGIDGGWSLDITTLEVTALAPTSGAVGTSVKIAGSGFTGATAVKFDGVASTVFTVDSDTQITATVPPGASSGPVSVTTPNGSVESANDFVVTVNDITSVTPRSGEVGDVVTLHGVGFTGATAVTFKQTAATTFTVVSDSTITAKVPTGASTGRISVTTPDGTAKSASAFVVRHARTVSIGRVGDTVKGRVRVVDAFGECGSAVPIKLQLRVQGGWQTVAGIFTKADGSYTVRRLDDPGAYRVVAKRTKLRSGDVCLKDVSKVAR